MAAPAAGQTIIGGDLDDAPPKCFDTTRGEPTCTKQANGRWDVTYDEPGGDGPPVGLFVVLALLVGGAVTLAKVAYARHMATEAGMDPGRATAVTLIDDDALSATYVATSVRQRQETPAAPAAVPPTAAERLRNLEKLQDDGLITPDEYAARRKVILDSL